MTHFRLCLPETQVSSHKAFFLLSLLKVVAILSIVKVPIYALCVVIDLNYSKMLEFFFAQVIYIVAIKFFLCTQVSINVVGLTKPS